MYALTNSHWSPYSASVCFDICGVNFHRHMASSFSFLHSYIAAMLNRLYDALQVSAQSDDVCIWTAFCLCTNIHACMTSKTPYLKICERIHTYMHFKTPKYVKICAIYILHTRTDTSYGALEPIGRRTHPWAARTELGNLS